MQSLTCAYKPNTQPRTACAQPAHSLCRDPPTPSDYFDERLSQGNARDFSCTRPSSSIEPNSKVGYGLGDVRDGGAEPRDPSGDADERRSSLRVALRGAASRQSAAVGTCGVCMTDQWTGGERAGRRFAGRFGRVCEALPPPALCLASCPHRACSLCTAHVRCKKTRPRGAQNSPTRARIVVKRLV